MKHFLNARDLAVTEAIDASVLLGEGKLARLDGFPSIKVVVRADWDRSSVAIVSGGGAGHEPAHVGFVGDGMLTAAVCGEIFASPSVDAVLSGILAVTGPAGCLLIVKNYTGDRLNFGLAAEKARALGLAVEMVIVADDVAIEGAARPRGIAGTLFVHKVAGHVARAGAPLSEVKAAAARAARETVSIGLSVSSVTIPGSTPDERLDRESAELGLGIHGEPGARVIPMQPMDALARTMLAPLLPAIAGTGPIAVLVNDLGGVPPIELAVATGAICATLAGTREVRLVVGPDRMMTSLDMKGISVSVLPLDPAFEEALLSPVSPRAWPTPRRPARVSPAPLPGRFGVVSYTASDHPGRRSALERLARSLVDHRTELDALDARIGDGDTGTTIATAAAAILAALDDLPLADAPQLSAALAQLLSTVMGGSSGILLAIFVAAMGPALSGDPPNEARAEGPPLRGAGARAPNWGAGLRAGVARIMEYGGASRGDRTMLDALIPATEAFDAEGDPAVALSRAARAAREGASATAALTRSRAGRSSYVREEVLTGVPDPGAVAVAIAFEALAR